MTGFYLPSNLARDSAIAAEQRRRRQQTAAAPEPVRNPAFTTGLGDTEDTVPNRVGFVPTTGRYAPATEDNWATAVPHDLAGARQAAATLPAPPPPTDTNPFAVAASGARTWLDRFQHPVGAPTYTTRQPATTVLGGLREDPAFRQAADAAAGFLPVPAGAGALLPTIAGFAAPAVADKLLPQNLPGRNLIVPATGLLAMEAASGAPTLRAAIRPFETQAATAAMRQAAPEAFQYGRGSIDRAGNLRPAAVRADDAIPRKTLVNPGGDVMTGSIVGGANKPPTRRQLEAITRRALAGNLSDGDRRLLMEELGRRIGATTPEEQAAAREAQFNGPVPPEPLSPEGQQLVDALGRRLRTVEQAGTVERSLANAREPGPVTAGGETLPVQGGMFGNDVVQARPENTPELQQGALFDREAYRRQFKRPEQQSLPSFPLHGGPAGGAVDMSGAELSRGIPHERWLPPGEIRTRPDLFQARDAPEGMATDQHRVQQIVDNFQPDRFEPITVARDPEGGYVVISGHHRLAAAEQLGLPEIPVRVVEGDISTPEARARLQNESAISNFLTAPQNVREQYNAFRTLEQNGASPEEIAAQTRQTANQVDRVLDIGRAGQVVLERVVQAPPTADIAASVGRAVRRFGISPDDAFGLYDAFVRRGRGESLPSGQAVWMQLEKLAPVIQQQGLPGFEGNLGGSSVPLYEAVRETVRLQDELVRTERRVQRDLRGAAAIGERTGVDTTAVQQAGQAEQAAIRQKLADVEAEVVARVQRVAAPQAAEAAADEAFPVQTGPSLFDTGPTETVMQPSTAEWVAQGQRPADAEAQLAAIRSGQGRVDPHVAEAVRAYANPQRITADLSDTATSGVPGIATRGQLRREIEDQLYGEGASVQGRRADLVLGVSASGKSKLFADPLRVTHGSLLVDADEAKRMLPEYAGGNGAGVVHQESSDIADAVQTRAMTRGDNLVLPLVGKNGQRIGQLVDTLNGHGYQVHVHYMDLPVEQAALRAYGRYLEGGQFVDPDYIMGLGEAPLNTYNALRTHPGVTSYEAYSNDVPYGTPPELLERGTGPAAGERLPAGQAAAGEGPGPGGRAGAGDAANAQGAVGPAAPLGGTAPPVPPNPPTAPPPGGGGTQGAFPGLPAPRTGTINYLKLLGEDAVSLATGGLKAAFDLSGFRQIGPAAYAHPLRARRAFAAELRAVSSEAGMAAENARMQAQPWAQLRTAVNPTWLKSVDIGLAPQERSIIAKLANKIPFYRASNRGFTTLLNAMSDELFGQMMRSDGRPLFAIPLEDVARYNKLANISVGRGPLPSFVENKVAGTPLLWAPRLFSARVSLPAEVLFGGNNAVRAEAARQLVAFVGVNTAILSLGKLACWWDVDLNPKSADFGQMRIGNVRLDPWGGYRPIANLIARMATGETKSTRTGDVYAKDRLAILGDFLRSKLAPGISTAINLKTGTDPTGQRFTLKDVPADLFAPLFGRDLYEAVTNHPSVGEAVASAAGGVGNFLGLTGQTTYERNPEDEYAQTQGKRAFSALSPSQKDAYYQAHPDRQQVTQQQAAERGGASGQYAQQQQKLAAEQQESDARLKAGELTWKQWTDDYHNRQQQLLGARSALGIGQNAPVRDDPLSRYYAFVRSPAATRADGTVDWEAVDSYLAQQPADAQATIDKETGVGGEGAVRVYRATSKALDHSGYYDLRDQAWVAFKAAHPQQLATLPDTYYGWLDQEVADTARELERDHNLAPAIAKQEAARQVSAYSTVDKFNEFYRNEYRHQWVVDNPQLATDAWGQERFTPDKAERNYLLAQGATRTGVR